MTAARAFPEVPADAANCPSSLSVNKKLECLAQLAGEVGLQDAEGRTVARYACQWQSPASHARSRELRMP